MFAYLSLALLLSRSPVPNRLNISTFFVTRHSRVGVRSTGWTCLKMRKETLYATWLEIGKKSLIVERFTSIIYLRSCHNFFIGSHRHVWFASSMMFDRHTVIKICAPTAASTSSSSSSSSYIRKSLWSCELKEILIK